MKKASSNEMQHYKKKQAATKFSILNQAEYFHVFNCLVKARKKQN